MVFGSEDSDGGCKRIYVSVVWGGENFFFSNVWWRIWWGWSNCYCYMKFIIGVKGIGNYNLLFFENIKSRSLIKK